VPVLSPRDRDEYEDNERIAILFPFSFPRVVAEREEMNRRNFERNTSLNYRTFLLEKTRSIFLIEKHNYRQQRFVSLLIVTFYPIYLPPHLLTGLCLAFYPICLFSRDIDAQLSLQRFGSHSGAVWLSIFCDCHFSAIIHPVYSISPDSGLESRGCCGCLRNSIVMHLNLSSFPLSLVSFWWYLFQ